MRAKIHPTWQLTTICAGIVVGAACARVWSGFGSWIWLGLGIMTCALALWRSRRILLIAACIGGLLVGLYRGGVDQVSLHAYEAIRGSQVAIDGKVSEDPSLSGSESYSMQLSDVRVGGVPYPGSLYVSIGADGASLRRSDRVQVKGMLEPGFGSFAAMMYRAQLVKATRPMPGDVALTVRDSFATQVRAGISEPEASLGVGFLLGQKSALPNHLVEALQMAGLTHIVVASGYNLMILVRLARRLFEKVSRYIATLASVSLIVGFIAMTGMTPSMTRAGLVAVLGLWAWYVGRKFHPVTLLLLAAAITVIVEPSNVWGNVGWMLSFAAFAGVMIVAPILSAYLFGREKLPFVAQLFVETTSAQLVTLPIIVAIFGQLSVVALLANLLILPLIPLAMLLTFITGLAGFVTPAVQGIIAWLAQALLSVIVRVVEWCASLPGAQIEWQVGVAVVVVAYAILIAGCSFMKWRSHFSLHGASVID